MTTRIAMWSGPRNISSAMMRAWENRSDTIVVDEPFYAYYLQKTGSEHTGANEVIASQSTDWRQVAHQLSATPIASEIFYQKHMTHHMLEEIDLNWTKELRHCFLIRDPLYVVNSYAKKRAEVTAQDIGVKRQVELYQQISDLSGQNIPIIDAKDVLSNPQLILEKLCDHFQIPFYAHMLHWPAGRRDSDGVWAKYWYHAVEASTGFAPFIEPEIDLSPQQRETAQDSRSYYLKLYESRLKID